MCAFQARLEAKTLWYGGKYAPPLPLVMYEQLFTPITEQHQWLWGTVRCGLRWTKDT